MASAAHHLVSPHRLFFHHCSSFDLFLVYSTKPFGASTHLSCFCLAFDHRH